jgi:hypothetical protein
VLNKAIFRDVAFSTIAMWTLVRIIAGRHNKVLSANECEKGFDFIHSENLLCITVWVAQKFYRLAIKSS